MKIVDIELQCYTPLTIIEGVTNSGRQTVHSGLRGILDDQLADTRGPIFLVGLRRLTVATGPHAGGISYRSVISQQIDVNEKSFILVRKLGIIYWFGSRRY